MWYWVLGILGAGGVVILVAIHRGSQGFKAVGRAREYEDTGVHRTLREDDTE